jgi:hypothetical protein
MSHLWEEVQYIIAISERFNVLPISSDASCPYT